MDASHLIKLLRIKHAEDVFVPECKNGPSQGTGHSRLDGWAMQKSWANPVTFGYECKVSRNDFIRDDKWQNYLELCSDFYFVCPFGMIQPEEIAHPAGLLWAAKTGERLWLKKKAARRYDVQIPETLWRYLLMRMDTSTPHTTAEFWARWVENKEASLDVGHRVGRKLNHLICDKILKVESENTRLQSENKWLSEVKTMLDEMGLSAHSWNKKERVKSMLSREHELFTPEFKRTLEQLKLAVDRALIPSRETTGSDQ